MSIIEFFESKISGDNHCLKLKMDDFVIKDVIDRKDKKHLYRAVIGEFTVVLKMFHGRPISASLETAFAKKLDHKNIVKIYGWFSNGPDAYVVMEYIPGVDLSKYIKHLATKNEILPMRHVISLVDAVAECHSKFIVHGDVKPGNVMFDTVNDRIVLIDFGLSFENTSVKVCGTPNYLPPECVAKKIRTSAIDIWSMGVTLYVIFSKGNVPFETTLDSRSMYNLFEAIKSYNDVIELKHGITEDQVRVISRFMRKNPLERISAFDAVALIRTLG
jgi:serine/threonine protein kinase